MGAYCFDTTKKKTFTAKKLRKGTAYKFVVVGMDDARVWGISPVVFATTSGSSYTMPKKVKVSKSKLSLKSGKTATLEASVVKAKAKGKMKTFRKVRFTSSDADVATVNAKTGKVKAVRVGSCTIYAYAQNGVASKVALTVTE